MKTISACIVISETDRSSFVMFTLMNLASKLVGFNVSYHILNNGNKDEHVLRFIEKDFWDYVLSENQSDYYEEQEKNTITLNESINFYLACNMIVREAKNEVVLLTRIGVFLDNCFVVNIFNHIERHNNNCVVSLFDELDKAKINLSFDSELEQFEKYFLDLQQEKKMNIMFMPLHVIHFQGLFNKSLVGTGYEMNEFFWRTRSNNFQVVFPIDEYCVSVFDYNEKQKLKGKILMTLSQQQMINNKTFKTIL